MAASVFSVGQNTKLSGTGLTGEYILLNTSVLSPEGGYVDWYIVHTGGGNVTFQAFLKGMEGSETVYYEAWYETAAGTLQQWTSGAITTSGTWNRVYRVPYPKGGIPALKVTYSATDQTDAISAKVSR